MQYHEMTYKEKQAYEKTLTTAQRMKIRKMEKEFTEQIQPVMYASHARQEEVLKEAYTSLKISDRIKALEEANAPRLNELQEKIQKLSEERSALRDKVSEERSTIQAESYSASYNDAQVLAMEAIRKTMKEQQQKKLAKLLESFKN